MKPMIQFKDAEGRLKRAGSIILSAPSEVETFHAIIFLPEAVLASVSTRKIARNSSGVNLDVAAVAVFPCRNAETTLTNSY
jgi:hypothetical protein